MDVYCIPNYSPDDLKKHDFTDGRAYRLQGPVHDIPKQTWVKNDWVIVKPLDGEDTTPGNRNDFELIITEVTDPKDDKKRFVELYSPSGHINYSIVEVSVHFCILFLLCYRYVLCDVANPLLFFLLCVQYRIFTSRDMMVKVEFRLNLLSSRTSL